VFKQYITLCHMDILSTFVKDVIINLLIICFLVIIKLWIYKLNHQGQFWLQIVQ